MINYRVSLFSHILAGMYSGVKLRFLLRIYSGEKGLIVKINILLNGNFHYPFIIFLDTRREMEYLLWRILKIKNGFGHFSQTKQNHYTINPQRCAQTICSIKYRRVHTVNERGVTKNHSYNTILYFHLSNNLQKY